MGSVPLARAIFDTFVASEDYLDQKVPLDRQVDHYLTYEDFVPFSEIEVGMEVFDVSEGAHYIATDLEIDPEDGTFKAWYLAFGAELYVNPDYCVGIPDSDALEDLTLTPGGTYPVILIWHAFKDKAVARPVGFDNVFYQFDPDIPPINASEKAIYLGVAVPV